MSCGSLVYLACKNVSFLSNRVPSQYHSVFFLLPFSYYHSLMTVICLCLLVYPVCCFCCCFHRRKISFMVMLCRHDSLLFSIRCLYYRQQVFLKAIKCVLVRKFDFFQTLPMSLSESKVIKTTLQNKILPSEIASTFKVQFLTVSVIKNGKKLPSSSFDKTLI